MTIISNEYANALFSLSKENSCEKQVYESLCDVKSVFEKTPDFLSFVLCPSISKQERLDVINNTLGGKIHEFVLSTICLLCENKSMDIFNEFFEEFSNMYSESKKISVAEVVVAKELSSEDLKKLTEKLEKISGNTVKLNIKTDPSIIGGITVTMDGKLYDGSIKNRIKSIKEVMNG